MINISIVNGLLFCALKLIIYAGGEALQSFFFIYTAEMFGSLFKTVA